MTGYFDWASTGNWASSAASRHGAFAGGGMSYSSLATAGTVTQVAGSLTSAVGAMAAAESSRSDLKSQALSMEFEANVSAINARNAERQAAAIMEAGSQEAMFSDLRYSAAKAAGKASAAARGLVVGAGAAAELAASTELARQADRRTIRLNAVRAANDARIAAVNERIRGSFAGVSASNARRSAGSIVPFVSASGGLLSGLGSAAREWAYDQRAYPPRR